MKPQRTTADLLERATAHHRAGRPKEAEAFYRKVLARKPRHDRALFMLSGLLFESGRFEEASLFLERLVAIAPHPAYLTNLGEAYRRQGGLDAAAAACRRALAEDPELPEAHHNLGLTLMNAGAPDEARPHLERAVALRPDSPLFQVSLAWMLLQLHQVAESAAHCRRAIDDAASLGAEARAWAKLHAEPLREHQRPHLDGDVDANAGADVAPARRLRVGYVSPDFRGHHPSLHFLMPLLRHHDRSLFDIYLYGSVERPDAATDAYRAWAGDHYRDIRRTDDVSAAELVRNDQIDILVDLAVHGAGHRLRLFACKPAPIQMTWLGYAGTTGLDSIDYRLTDRYIDPPGTELGVYTETSLHLPETFWCYDALESDLPVRPLPALTAGFITFGCLGSPRKVHPGVVSLWARVLGAVPDSRLLLVAEEHARAPMRRAFEAAGIQADRIEFTGRVRRRQYLESYHRIDVGLDTFPFAGGTTTLDATWMGVPVVTLNGGTALHRAGVSIAMNLELPELVADSPDQYVSVASALVGDLERLNLLRAQLRSRLEASPLGDAGRFARHLEAAYRTVWVHRRKSTR